MPSKIKLKLLQTVNFLSSQKMGIFKEEEFLLQNMSYFLLSIFIFQPLQFKDYKTRKKSEVYITLL